MTEAQPERAATSRPDYGRRLWPVEAVVRAVSRWRGEDGRLGRVLEVGCGIGNNLWFLSEHAADVVGVDADPGVLKTARAYLSSRIPLLSMMPRLYHTDARDLRLAQGPFHAVIDSMTSQHLPWADHPLAYAEYRRVLRPGGRLLVYHLDAHTGWRSEYSDDSYDVDQCPLFPSAGLVCLPDWLELQDVIEAAGFSVTAHERIVRIYDNENQASYSAIEAVAR